MRIPLKFVWHMFAYICFVAILCEFLIYYFVIFQCSWPVLDPLKEDSSIHIKTNSNEPVKAMFLADTHLLGSRNGHWFDKLRREWQMHRAFKTAVSLHKPEVVFFLGDIFDEGLWCGKDEFEYYVARFNSLFRVPEGTKDKPLPARKIHECIQCTPIKIASIRGNHFVLLNSMAMEGDGCFLCRQAEIKLMGIADKLRCIQGVGKSCDPSLLRKQYSHPIILQHFPMFRDSDRNCDEPDEAPEDLKKMKFRERWECLSQEATDMLFYQLKPRAVFTGHTHHGCHTTHKVPGEIHEYTLPSFSWRNKNNPSFMLAMISPNNYAVSKCYMPQESTVIFLYSISLSFFVFWAARRVYLLSSKRSHSVRLFKSC